MPDEVAVISGMIYKLSLYIDEKKIEEEFKQIQQYIKTMKTKYPDSKPSLKRQQENLEKKYKEALLKASKSRGQTGDEKGNGRAT